jgi:hypothetical protein
MSGHVSPVRSNLFRPTRSFLQTALLGLVLAGFALHLVDLTQQVLGTGLSAAQPATGSAATSSWPALFQIFTQGGIGLFLVVIGLAHLRRCYDRSKESRNSPRWYRLLWICGLLAVLIIVAAVNITVNPHSLYGTKNYVPRIEWYMDKKIDLLNAFKPEPNLMIMGSSRAIRILPSYVLKKLHYNAFNFAFQGLTLPALAPSIKLIGARNSQKLPEVLFVELWPSQSYLGPNSAIEFAPLEILPFLSFAEQQDYVRIRLEQLFDRGQLVDALYILKEYADKGTPFVEPITADGGIGLGEMVSEEGLTRGVDNMIARAPIWPCPDWSPDTIRDFEELGQFTEQYKTSVVFFIPPAHPRFLAAFKSGLDQCTEVIERYLRPLMTRYPRLFYLNFLSTETIGGVNTQVGFLDGIHMTTFNGDRLIDSASDTLQQAMLLAAQARNEPPPALTPPTQSSIRVEFDGDVADMNWYPPEKTRDGESYQWMGPEPTALLHVEISTKRPLQLTFCIYNAITANVLSTLRVRANGQPINLSKTFSKSCQFLYRGVIPSEVLARSQGPLVLGFEVSETHKPGIIMPSNNDPRKIGVSLTWLTLEPISQE